MIDGRNDPIGPCPTRSGKRCSVSHQFAETVGQFEMLQWPTMESDKQIYLIFQWQPQWVFLLLHEAPPLGARFESVTLKSIEKRVDAAWIPADDSLAILVAEFQGYDDGQIYVRIVQEMAMLRSQHPKRKVRGLVIFLESRFDPDSDPWREFVEVIYLDEALEQLSHVQPDHPMVAVFAPLFAESEELLETEAAECYNRINSPELDRASVAGLQEVFVSWLMQRLPYKGAEEIEEMLLGKLPDIRNTKSGQELIAIGLEQGRQEGMDRGKLVGQVQLLESLCKSIPTLEEPLRCMSIEQLKNRLNELRNIFDARQP